MGFAANFLTVASSISQLYDIDLKISQLENQKLAIASVVDIAADVDTNFQNRVQDMYRGKLGLGKDGQPNRNTTQQRNDQIDTNTMFEMYAALSKNGPGNQVKRQLSMMEKRIDQKLEQMKAIRTALNSRKEEFQKYIQENIKSAFTNRYMGG